MTRYLLTGGPADGYTMVSNSNEGETVESDTTPGKYVRVGIQETVEVMLWVAD